MCDLHDVRSDVHSPFKFVLCTSKVFTTNYFIYFETRQQNQQNSQFFLLDMPQKVEVFMMLVLLLKSEHHFCDSLHSGQRASAFFRHPKG